MSGINREKDLAFGFPDGGNNREKEIILTLPDGQQMIVKLYGPDYGRSPGRIWYRDRVGRWHGFFRRRDPAEVIGIEAGSPKGD